MQLVRSLSFTSVAVVFCGFVAGLGVAEATGSGTYGSPWLIDSGWNYYGHYQSYPGDVDWPSYTYLAGYNAWGDSSYPNTEDVEIDRAYYSTGSSSDDVWFQSAFVWTEHGSYQESYTDWLGNFDLYCDLVSGISATLYLNPDFEGTLSGNEEYMVYSQDLVTDQCPNSSGHVRDSLWQGQTD